MQMKAEMVPYPDWLISKRCNVIIRTVVITKNRTKYVLYFVLFHFYYLDWFELHPQDLAAALI